jgi:hypothetical protein
MGLFYFCDKDFNTSSLCLILLRFFTRLLLFLFGFPSFFAFAIVINFSFIYYILGKINKYKLIYKRKSVAYMSEILGTIKITDDRIITKKGELVETWSRWSGDDSIFIVYDGIRYKLLTSE